MNAEQQTEVGRINDEIKMLTDKLDTVTGTECEVYSRIVGYYRNTKNWNPGKAQEFEERVVFDVR